MVLWGIGFGAQFRVAKKRHGVRASIARGSKETEQLIVANQNIKSRTGLRLSLNTYRRLVV